MERSTSIWKLGIMLIVLSELLCEFEQRGLGRATLAEELGLGGLEVGGRVPLGRATMVGGNA